MDTLEELRALRRDLNELGDSIAVALLGRAERCFPAWRFDEGERFMEQALRHFEETQERKPEPQGRWPLLRELHAGGRVTAGVLTLEGIG